VLQTEEWQWTFRANFHNGAYTDDDLVDHFIQVLTAPFNIFGMVYIPPGVYHFARHQFTWGSNPGKSLFYSFFERFGSFYNGSLNEFRVRSNLRPSPQVSLALTHTWNRFVLNGQVYNVQVGSLNVAYSFSRFLTTSGLFQVNSVDPQPVSLNLRVRYQYRPDSDLFVIYTLGSQFNALAAGNPVLLSQQRLVVKWTYSFLK
jgi:hypothetical protein